MGKSGVSAFVLSVAERIGFGRTFPSMKEKINVIIIWIRFACQILYDAIHLNTREGNFSVFCISLLSRFNGLSMWFGISYSVEIQYCKVIKVKLFGLERVWENRYSARCQAVLFVTRVMPWRHTLNNVVNLTTLFSLVAPCIFHANHRYRFS